MSASSRRYITGVTYSRPLLRPRWWTSATGAPSKLPPTRPPLARNSVMILEFQSFASGISASSCCFRSAGGRGVSSREVRSHEGGRSIEGCIPLVEQRGVRLEHVRNPRTHLEGHGYVRGGCPCGQADCVAQEDLVGAHLDQHRGQPAEVTVYGADVRI